MGKRQLRCWMGKTKVKRILIIIGAGTVLLAGVGFYYWQTHLFVLSTSPKNNEQKAPSTTAITIHFNQDLDPTNLQRFSISPKVTGKIRIDGSKLIFEPDDSLKLHTTYNVRVVSPTSQSGRVGSDINLNFTAEYVEFAKLPAGEKQRQIDASDSLEQQFKIVSALPHETTHYKITYQVTADGPPILQITLHAILNRPDQLEQYNQDLKDYKTEALTYIRSKGDDPKKYPIEYDPAEAKDL